MDATIDTASYYAVITTGIYCRRNCGARRPRPENIRYFCTAAAAQAAGFRACKRCKPDRPDPQPGLIAAACRAIEAAETPLSLQILAAAAGLSPFHFHRLFKAATGVTPKAYAAAQRDTRLRDALPKAATVTQAVYDAGYNAASRFYATAGETLGMTPKAYRAGAPGTDISYATAPCRLGTLLAAASPTGICAIALGDDPAALVSDLRGKFPRAQLAAAPDFAATLAAIIAFIDTPGARLSLPLDIAGTAFQRRVWQALTKIPAGATASYTDIAAAIGAPKSARAVAAACAANPLAVAIPCHRAIRADGGLAGYRWGLARKRQLLDAESANAE
jgi:AraC family transcriptional regulator of adaptative response/methylated-DNA-[protein]-cysteine methyltransferase